MIKAIDSTVGVRIVIARFLGPSDEEPLYWFDPVATAIGCLVNSIVWGCWARIGGCSCLRNLVKLMPPCLPLCWFLIVSGWNQRRMKQCSKSSCPPSNRPEMRGQVRSGQLRSRGAITRWGGTGNQEIIHTRGARAPVPKLELRCSNYIHQTRNQLNISHNIFKNWPWFRFMQFDQRGFMYRGAREG